MHIERTQLPWACLAAAIIKTGEMSNDAEFLESAWCAMLRQMVDLAIESEKTSANKSSDFVIGAKNGGRI